MTKIRKNITPCTADIPPPPSTSSRSGNLGSSAVFDKNVTWKPNSTGTISIKFDPNNGAWSHLGSDSNSITPSMNLGWVDPPIESFDMDGYNFNSSLFNNEARNYCQSLNCSEGERFEYKGDTYVCLKNNIVCIDNWEPGTVVLHEFGHALGMYHEHQNFIDGTPIEYDLDGAALFSLHQRALRGQADMSCVNEYCSKICLGDVSPSFCDGSPCNSSLTPSGSCQTQWEAAKTEANGNVLEKYNCTPGEVCDYEGSSYDANSIMLYYTDDYMIKPDSNGERVNPTRKNFEFSNTDKEWLSRIYPVDNPSKPVITVEFLDGEDWQKYWVKKLVLQYLQPCVGINFVFNLPVREETKFNETCEYYSEPMETNPPYDPGSTSGGSTNDGSVDPGSSGSPTGTPTSTVAADKSASNIFGFIIVALVVLIMFYLLFF